MADDALVLDLDDACVPRDYDNVVRHAGVDPAVAPRDATNRSVYVPDAPGSFWYHVAIVILRIMRLVEAHLTLDNRIGTRDGDVDRRLVRESPCESPGEFGGAVGDVDDVDAHEEELLAFGELIGARRDADARERGFGRFDADSDGDASFA